ncbi:TPA: hypothetical protein HA265_07785, partial [Candidatus Woesearchaeota archaeon]|nr:hypothetical protein [Candidatus Woesearchaeota archaeon]
MEPMSEGKNMKKETIYNIAAFMIFLIVMLPLCSANAWAATINVPIKTYGSKGIAGFRAPKDTTTVEVSVTHPEDPELGPNQVKALEDPTRPFECSIVDPQTTTSICKSTYPETELPAAIGVIQTNIQVFGDGNQPMSTPAQLQILVDHLPPTINSIKYTPKPEGLVEAAYQVSDEACSDPLCANKCSGVTSLTFKVGEDVIGKQENITPDCSVRGIVNLTGVVSEGQVATKHICVVAADRMGMTSTSCADVKIDAKPPEITGAALTGAGKIEIKYSNGQPLGAVKLVVNLTEDSGLKDPENAQTINPVIYINASDLSERADQQAQLSNIAAPCAKVYDTKYTCEAQVFFIMTKSRPVNIEVTAMDIHDNELQTTKSLNIGFDNVAPKAKKMYTDFTDDRGLFWLNTTGNRVHLDIEEATSGFASRQVSIDIRGLGAQAVWGSQLTIAQANKCAPGWKCTWENLASSSADGSAITLSTAAASKDDAGNPLEVFRGVFYTDQKKPEILYWEATTGLQGGQEIRYTETKGGGRDEKARQQVASGEPMVIRLYVEDFTPVRAWANLSKVLKEFPGHEADPGTCKEFTTTDYNLSIFINKLRSDMSKRLWECTWITGPTVAVPIEIQPKVETELMFKVQDLVKHDTFKKDDIDLLGKENVTADYWQYEWQSQSPKNGIDRRTWPISQPVSYQHFRLNPRFSGLRIVSLSFDGKGCSGDLEYIFFTESGTPGLEIRGYDVDYTDGLDDIIEVQLNP